MRLPGNVSHPSTPSHNGICVVISYRSQGNRGRRQANQPPIARVRLVHGVGVVMAQLVHDLGDLVVVVLRQRTADRVLESVALVGQFLAVEAVLVHFLRFRDAGEEGDEVGGEGHCGALSQPYLHV